VSCLAVGTRSVRGLFFCRPVARVVLLRGVEKTSDRKKKKVSPPA
jgi:hypothetical protein